MIDWSRFELVKLNKIYMTVMSNKKGVYLSQECLDLLGTCHIKCLINEKAKQIAFTKAKRNNKYMVSVRGRCILSEDLVEIIEGMDNKHRTFYGEWASEEKAIIFQL